MYPWSLQRLSRAAVGVIAAAFILSSIASPAFSQKTDTNTGADNSGRGADNSGSGADNSGRGADDSGRGADNSGRGDQDHGGLGDHDHDHDHGNAHGDKSPTH
jgi:hypothetical protein